MSKAEKDLWDYATVVFSIPKMRLEVASKTLGVNNIKAIISSASEKIKEVNADIADINRDIKKANKTKSKLLIDEANARNAESILIQRNVSSLIKLLKKLRSETVKSDFVLPKLRNANYFSIGDKVMVYATGIEGAKKIINYDWISGIILCPNWSGETHCISNNKWSKRGSCGGHYIRTIDQDIIFKRSDFYKIRKMLKEGKNDAQINMMHQNLAEKISGGTVEPLTDNEIALNQPKFIRRLAKIVDIYRDHIPIIAKRYSVKI